jgi:hypothetical protein
VTGISNPLRSPCTDITDILAYLYRRRRDTARRPHVHAWIVRLLLGHPSAKSPSEVRAVVPPRAARERALDQTRSGGSVRPRPRRKHVRVPPGRGRLSTRRGVPCNPSMVRTARCERVTGPRPRGAARAVPRGTGVHSRIAAVSTRFVRPRSAVFDRLSLNAPPPVTPELRPPALRPASERRQGGTELCRVVVRQVDLVGPPSATRCVELAARPGVHVASAHRRRAGR